MSDIDFMQSIKIVPDKEKELLLKLQTKLDKEDTTLENILKIIKNLNENEKEKLKQLYIKQIYDLNSSIKNYKKRILKMKKK